MITFLDVFAPPEGEKYLFAKIFDHMNLETDETLICEGI